MNKKIFLKENRCTRNDVCLSLICGAKLQFFFHTHSRILQKKSKISNNHK